MCIRDSNGAAAGLQAGDVVCLDGTHQLVDHSFQRLYLEMCIRDSPVSYEAIERAVTSIEQTLLSSYDREIPSVRIGELTMQELKDVYKRQDPRRAHGVYPRQDEPHAQ